MVRSLILAGLAGLAQAQVDTSAILGLASSIGNDITSGLGVDTSALAGLTSLTNLASSLPAEVTSVLGSASAAVTRSSGLTTSASVTGSANAAASGNYISALIGNGYLQGGFAASVIGGDACRTTYAVACTESICGSGQTAIPSGITVTVTQGPSTYLFSTSVSTRGVAVSLSQNCQISGSTSATCTAAIAATAEGQSTSSTVSTTYSAKYQSITVTGGTVPTGSCTSTGNAAVATAIVDLYKVVAVPAAALAAAAVMI